MLVVLVLMAVLLMFGGSTSVLAKSARKVTGGVNFEAFGSRIWMNYNIHETDPATGTAEGRVAWKMYNEGQTENNGWRYLVARVDCVTFGEDVVNGDPQAAVFRGQIISKEGWGPGAPGMWLRWWVRDGGTPSVNVDQWASQLRGAFPDEFWPENERPGCDYFWPGVSPNTPPQPFDLEKGNLTIHH
jgi:hypothetical protein